MTTPSQVVLGQGCAVLASRSVELSLAYDVVGVPIWRDTPPNYETLARAVAYQLISTKAADAIWGRTLDLFGDRVSAEAVIEMPDDALRACGNSRPKIGHMKSIAKAITDGSLCFRRVQDNDLAEARKELLAVKGIGPWTADLFLMNAVGHVDAFPIGDVGMMEAYRALSGAHARHDTKTFTALAENWQPYRGVAAHLLWGWLNLRRGATSA